MTPVEKTTPNPGHAHKGQIELGPATVTWAGDAAVQASEHSEFFFWGANTRFQTLAGGHNQRPPHQTSSAFLV